MLNGANITRYIVLSFVAVSVNAGAQPLTEKVRQQFERNGIVKENHMLIFCENTATGTFATVQTIQPVETVVDDQTYHGFITTAFNSYLMQDDTLIEVDELHQFKVYGYMPANKVLIVGLFNPESYTDPQVESLFTYSLSTQKLSSQGYLKGGIYGARANNNQVSLLLNVKNKGGVGSNLMWVPFTIK